MDNLTAEQELRLVNAALRSGLSNCVIWWDEKVERRIRQNKDLADFTPNRIIDVLIDWVEAGGKIVQVKETRTEYSSHFDFYYKAILLIGHASFSNGLFVEMRLTDTDEDCPMVSLVNAHPQPE